MVVRTKKWTNGENSPMRTIACILVQIYLAAANDFFTPLKPEFAYYFFVPGIKLWWVSMCDEFLYFAEAFMHLFIVRILS